MVKGLLSLDFDLLTSPLSILFPAGEGQPDKGRGWLRNVERSVAPLLHGSEAPRGGICTGRGAVAVQSTKPRARLDADLTSRYLCISRASCGASV